jgi:hypothetical protein
MVGAILLGAVLGLHVPVAQAHNLQTKMVYMFFDDATQAMLDARIASLPLWSSHLISRPILVQAPVETCLEARLSRATTIT